MRQQKRTVPVMGVMGLMALFSVAAGCSPREIREDAAEAAAATERGVTRAGEATGDAAASAVGTAGYAAATAVEATQDAAATAVEATQDVAQAAAWTTKIKAVLLADSRINAWKVDVDSLPDKRTVVITGEVPTAADRRYVTVVAARAISPTAPVLIINETLIDRDR